MGQIRRKAPSTDKLEYYIDYLSPDGEVVDREYSDKPGRWPERVTLDEHTPACVYGIRDWTNDEQNEFRYEGCPRAIGIWNGEIDPDEPVVTAVK